MSPALLVVVALLAFGHAAKEKPELSDEIKEIIEHVHNECVAKTAVAEVDIANCENGIFKEDNKLKCYMFCLLEEGSLVDDDGNVDYDLMINTPDKDKCQRAFDVHQCSYKQDPNFYFLF
ncbi:unnamed protein product [Leptidea sinapis]|uniref:Uncharacterized protein n=1 Tax=Leptidea sinapis TaxID=189913 RepID=A0A5E4QTD4_9NEOP|nr:unnamed protein product [Leptidea sinapis]